MEDLAKYLDEIVTSTVADFEQNPTSTRHAFIACVVTCHTVDYLAFPEDPRTLRQKFSHQSAEFKIVDEVGHAFKHVIAGARKSPRFKADQVVRRPPAIWGEMAWGLSRWGDYVGGVTLASDPTVDVLEVVKRAVEFLRSQLAEPA